MKAIKLNWLVLHGSLISFWFLSLEKFIYVSVARLIIFRFEKDNKMFSTKSTGMIYTGHCLHLTRSTWILFPKSNHIKHLSPYKDVHTKPKSVAEFYDKKSVVITGGNGFIGTTLVSKLLRSCPGLKSIFLLLRKKDGCNIQTRIDDMFRLPVSLSFFILIWCFVAGHIKNGLIDNMDV